MRLAPILLAFLALLALGAITWDGFAQVDDMHRLGVGVLSDDAKTKSFRAKAEKGDAQAQFDLGSLYLFHDYDSNFEVDHAKGMGWIRKSAAQGNVRAQDLMGCLHYQGRILAKDEVEAVKWFRKAAAQGDAYAQFNLGHCFYKGEGVVKNMDEAVRLFRLAAARGEETAQHKLARILESGEGVPKDYAEAARLFFNLALQAERTLPKIPWPHRSRSALDLNSADGNSASSLRKAADAGDAQAQYLMGKNHYFGIGLPEDHVQAVKWWLKAAEQADSASQFNLGVMYFHGRGTGKNFAEATKWFRKCSMQKQMMFFCGVGRPMPLPMVVGIQTELITPMDGPEIR